MVSKPQFSLAAGFLGMTIVAGLIVVMNLLTGNESAPTLIAMVLLFAPALLTLFFVSAGILIVIGSTCVFLFESVRLTWRKLVQVKLS
jgi:hypothetical protein